MRVTVVCFGALREFLSPQATTNEMSLEVEEGVTVGDVVDRLGAPRRLVFSALVGESRAGLDERLRDGARLTLMPPFTGGQRED